MTTTPTTRMTLRADLYNLLFTLRCDNCQSTSPPWYLWVKGGRAHDRSRDPDRAGAERRGQPGGLGGGGDARARPDPAGGRRLRRAPAAAGRRRGRRTPAGGLASPGGRPAAGGGGGFRGPRPAGGA